jgi:surfactin synthase thioesterase subunit
VYIGRYERSKEISPDSIQEIIDVVVSNIVDLDHIPISFISHSYGTMLAYQVAVELDRKFNVKIQHFVSIAGISMSYLNTLPIYTMNPSKQSRLLELMQDSAVTMFGKIPSYLQNSANLMQREASMQGEYTLQIRFLLLDN